MTITSKILKSETFFPVSKRSICLRLSIHDKYWWWLHKFRYTLLIFSTKLLFFPLSSCPTAVLLEGLCCAADGNAGVAIRLVLQPWPSARGECGAGTQIARWKPKADIQTQINISEVRLITLLLAPDKTRNQYPHPMWKLGTFPETSGKVYVWCMRFILNFYCAMPFTLENLGKRTAKTGLKPKAVPTSHLFRDVRKPLVPMAAFTLERPWNPQLILRLCRMWFLNSSQHRG